MSSPMEGSPPHLPPSTPPSLPPQLPARLEPQVVKVFGILHLVFAGFGVLSLIWGFAAQFFMRGMMNSKDPAQALQVKMQDELGGVTIMTNVFHVVLVTFLLISGIRLVKGCPGGVAWSNRYAWTSIAFKIATVVVGVIFILPAMQRQFDTMAENFAGMPGGGGQGFLNTMKISTAVGTVLGPLLMCIYPALALYLLSRPAVKEWVAARRRDAP